MSGEKTNFQYILRLLNTNVDGKEKIMYALTQVKGVGRRYSNLVCKKADVDLNKRYVGIILPYASSSPTEETNDEFHRNPTNQIYHREKYPSRI